MDDAEKKDDLGQEQSPVNDTDNTTVKTPGIDPEISLEEMPQVEALAPVEQEFTFKLKESEVNLILRGLGELPLKDAYNFVGKFISEISKQKVPK